MCTVSSLLAMLVLVSPNCSLWSPFKALLDLQHRTHHQNTYPLQNLFYYRHKQKPATSEPKNWYAWIAEAIAGEDSRTTHELAKGYLTL